MTRKCISHILDLREILLSIQTGFSLVKAAVVCAILESISGLEPSSVITKPRYLKLVTTSSFYPFTLISVLMPLVLFVTSLVFSALISMPTQYSFAYLAYTIQFCFFPLSLCLAIWFWPDLMNQKHDHTTAVSVSLRSSGGLRVVQLPAGSWHRLPCW